jgi:two-component system, cell cycle response regulator
MKAIAPGGLSSPRSPHLIPRVLIVEDDSLWRRMLRHTLSKRGAILVEATSLAEASERVAEESFDLVFIDYELPDGCGLDLISVADRHRLGRIVLASGFVDPEDLHDDRCDEVSRFLTKPYLSSDLAGCLDGLVRVDTRLGTVELLE